MHVNGFHWFHWFHSVCRCDCPGISLEPKKAKEMPLQQVHLRPRADALCLRTCHPVPRRPLHRTSGKGHCGHWEHGMKNVKSCEEMWRDVKGMLTGWEWPCMTWEGDLEPGFEVRKVPHHSGVSRLIDNFAMCDLVFATLIRQNQIISNPTCSIPKSQIWHNSYTRLYQGAREVQGGPWKYCRFVSLRVASCRLRAGRWLQRSKAKGHQLGGYREWYPKIRRELVLPGKPWGNRETNVFFF